MRHLKPKLNPSRHSYLTIKSKSSKPLRNSLNLTKSQMLQKFKNLTPSSKLKRSRLWVWESKSKKSKVSCKLAKRICWNSCRTSKIFLKKSLNWQKKKISTKDNLLSWRTFSPTKKSLSLSSKSNLKPIKSNPNPTTAKINPQKRNPLKKMNMTATHNPNTNVNAHRKWPCSNRKTKTLRKKYKVSTGS